MLLSLSDFGVSYGVVPAVSGIDLAVGAGEIVSVIGPNGAGKTSLLAGVMGLVQHTGHVRLENRDLADRPPFARSRAGMGYVPTGLGVFPSLSVRDNVTVATRMKGNEVWERLCDWFPLLHARRNSLASELSGGQRQVVSIARAMAGSPKVLLLDEPSMGLSPIAIASLKEAIATLMTNKVGILLSEQNAALALSISDRCLLMVRGEARLGGTPAELRGHDEVEALYLGRTV